MTVLLLDCYNDYFPYHADTNQIFVCFSGTVVDYKHVSAPSQAPAGVRVTLIEDGTALVSWREPTDPSVVVTHYTILYASQKAWLAGRWQVMQREGE